MTQTRKSQPHDCTNDNLPAVPWDKPSDDSTYSHNTFTYV